MNLNRNPRKSAGAGDAKGAKFFCGRIRGHYGCMGRRTKDGGRSGVLQRNQNYLVVTGE